MASIHESSRDKGEEYARGEPEHQDSSHCLHRTQKAPVFRQHEVAVAHRRVGDAGKVERRFRIRKAFLPPVKQCPYRNLCQVNDDEPTGDANKQPRHRQEPRILNIGRQKPSPQQYDQPGGMNDHRESKETQGNEEPQEHQLGKGGI